MAGDAGLFVTVRIGPYVCAEWNGGGLPLWLRDVDNFSCCRCDDAVWEREMARWVRVVAGVIEPFLPRHGGPVILAQIENELHGDPTAPCVPPITERDLPNSRLHTLTHTDASCPVTRNRLPETAPPGGTPHSPSHIANASPPLTYPP